MREIMFSPLLCIERGWLLEELAYQWLKYKVKYYCCKGVCM